MRLRKKLKIEEKNPLKQGLKPEKKGVKSTIDPWKTIRDKNLGNRRVSKLKNTTDKLKDRQKNTGHY